MPLHYGKTFDALRPDQQAYVLHCLSSWGYTPFYTVRFSLRRAIKKAKQNYP